jgi:hypothetical protein
MTILLTPTRRVRVFRNPGGPRWRRGTLPVRQTLLWVGPVFVQVSPR